MLTWTLIDTGHVPGTGERLRLMRRGEEYSIWLDGGVLMGSRMRGSEEALARLGCERLAARPRSGGGCVLIGGLGMGFTLRAALAVLGPADAVVVAELVPAVVAWARGPLAHLSAGSLEDRRLSVHEGDVGALIASRRAAFDAILLDVDNGPEGLTRAANDGLYGTAMLRAIGTALRPGGVLCVWSVAPDRAFAQRLARTGFAVEELSVRAHGMRGTRHVIWRATRPG